MPRLHSGPACDRPETNEKSKLPPIPEVVWQQPMENDTNQDNLNNTTNDSTLKTNVASQTSPPKGTQPQNHVDTTEQPSGNQTGNEPVSFLDCSKKYSTNTRNTEQHVVTTPNGLTTTLLLTTATPLIEEGLVRDEQSNEIYLPLTSTVVLKRKQEMLYVPLDFENNLTVDALVDFVGEPFFVSQNFWYRKNLRIRGGGYHDFLSKLFCLTVPKNFVGEPFCASQNF